MNALVFSTAKDDIFSNSQIIANRGGKVIAQYGIVSKKQTSKLKIDSPVFFADIRWKALLKLVQNSKPSYKELSKFPAVSRDLALLIDKNIEFAEIEAIAYKTEKKLLKEVSLFDVYEGKNIEAGKISYAINFVLQDEENS